MFNLQVFGPTLASAGLLLSLVYTFGRDSSLVRMAGAILCAYLGIRYISWRLESGVPFGQSPIQDAWAWIFLGFEALNVFSATVLYLFLSRRRDRHADADARQNSPLLQAPVDVFIATYNEPYDILERTIVGACAIEHSDLRVWVLDDGARDWVRALAEELGAHYTFRVKGSHAKAGNVNNGLKVAVSTGRRPEFVLLLDADFVPHRNILCRTLGLFEETDVGIVQTPQHFFNPDPIQSNLLCSHDWPDEQRFFFNTILPSKDAWGAAFCCGTSAVFRVAAMEACGGMAVETVTEDMLTTFKMQEFGYRTIFLNERLSLGLAPEGLHEYMTQRGRWCLGAVQQIYTRWSFAGPARLPWVSRLSCLDSFMFWSVTYPFKIMVITAPGVYWWTTTAVLDCTIPELIYWLVPSVVTGALFMAIYSGKRVLPVMTDVTQLLASFVIMRSVGTGLVRPFGHKFKVTAKGLSTSGITVQWPLLIPFLVMAAATTAGIIVNVSAYSPLKGTPGYNVNVFWSVFNVAVLMIAVCVCIELPKRRKDERFTTHERGVILWPGGSGDACVLRDISLGGAQVMPETDWDGIAGYGTLCLNEGELLLPFTPIRTVGNTLVIKFEDTPGTRRRLIRKLFTGDYNNEVTQVSISHIARALYIKLFS